MISAFVATAVLSATTDSDSAIRRDIDFRLPSKG